MISKESTTPIFIKELFQNSQNQPLDLMQRVINHKQAYDKLQSVQNGLIKNPAKNSLLYMKREKGFVLVVPTVDQVGKSIECLQEKYPLYKHFYTIYLSTKNVASFVKSCSVLQKNENTYFFCIVPVGGNPKNVVSQMQVALKKELARVDDDLFLKKRLNFILSYIGVKQQKFLPSVAMNILSFCK